MTIFERERGSITTVWGKRPAPQTDLWYLITQDWILCDNNWNTIVFHTGVFDPYIIEWWRDRKADIIEDEEGLSIFIEAWTILEGEDLGNNNKIDTLWTNRN